MTNTLPHMPPWFDPKDDRYNLGDDPRLWFSSLVIRKIYRIRFDEGTFNECSDNECSEFWKEYLFATAKNVITDLNLEPSPKPVEEISLNAILSNPDSFAEWEIGLGGKYLLLIDMDYSDVKIQEGMNEILLKLRKQNPLPISRRGKPAFNLQITPEHLESWARYKILQVYDLDFWAEIMQQPRLSHSDLANLVAPEYNREDPKEWGVEAREKLTQAFACIELLV